MSSVKSVAVILTYNEEANIVQAVANAQETFETVYVLDSHSTDQTVNLAQKAGASIITNKFVNFSAQRNFAMKHCDAEYDWLFFLDADEKIDHELSKSLKQILGGKPKKPVAYKMQRDNYFLGRILNHVAGNDWQTRLFGKFEGLRYSGEVHEGVISPHLDHQFMSGRIIHTSQDTISDLFAKTNHYTSLEILKKKSYSTTNLIFRLLYIPFLTFFKSYILRKGFLDGYRGLIYAKFMAVYKFVLICKQIEKNLKT